MAIDAGTRKLVGYVRVSSVAGRDANEEAFKSPSVQREAMERWATAKYGRKHKWLNWLIDLDTSGSTHSRPLLDQASDLAIANNADLIVYNFSRYSRNLPEGLTALRKLLDKGVTVYAATGGLSGGTAEDDLTLAMFMMMNQYQLAKIAESWQHTIRRNKEEGRWHGVVPYGYRRATTEEMKKLGRTVGVIVPDTENAKNVLRIFKMYAQGDGLFEIGKYGVEHKWFSRIGTAKDILRNPAYIGRLPVKEYVPAINRETSERRLDRHRRPLKEVKTNSPIGSIDGKHKAIVPRALWDKVQIRLEKEKRAPRTKFTHPRYFGARRVRCANCGKMLVFQVREEYNYLTCPGKLCTKKPGSVKVHELEAVVTQFIHELPIVITPALDRALKERNRASNEIRTKKAKLDREIERYSDNRGTLALMLALDEYPNGLSQENVGAALDKVAKDLELAIKERLELEEADDAVPRMEQLQQAVIGIGKLWDLAGVAHRGQILQSLSIEIHIEPSKKYNDPLDGRVTVVTALPSGELIVQAEAKKSPKKVKSGLPKKPR